MTDYRLTVADTFPPDTVISSGPPALTTTTDATFTFTGTDDKTPAGSLTFEGRLDSGDFVPVTSPLTLTNLSPGYHTFSVRAIDAAAISIRRLPASRSRF